MKSIESKQKSFNNSSASYLGYELYVKLKSFDEKVLLVKCKSNSQKAVIKHIDVTNLPRSI